MNEAKTADDGIGSPASQRWTSRAGSFLAILGLIAGLLIWLWPFGLGGSMPVGGDVTQFFLGLMSVLSTSLAAHRLPVWNDLWGYGFPGIGESQMGVFYPPHLLLYGCLSLERAYVASLVLHTLWGGLGAYWAARRFGVSQAGSAFSAFTFSASAFFVIHMPHPWGYTTGAWLPWAWGLAWSLLNTTGPGAPRRLFLLTVVLVLQILPGHFQIAFMTQVGVGVMASWVCLERIGRKPRGEAARGSALVALALLLVMPLAALQVWPTARLARLAASQRDYEYLSGFAATPFHLVSLVAPDLFHRSPLWRPLVWDPFHTSPEEYLAYVGLLPLFLAILTVVRDVRRDAGVRCLTVLAVVGLLLSLGPYVPGFRLLIELPGFSFFRAPARWGLPTSLALAILAGRGLDRWPAWERPGRGIMALVVATLVWIAAVVGLIELALWSTSPSGSPAVAKLFDRAFQIRPWTDDQDFFRVAGLARRPTIDPNIPPALERAGLGSKSRDSRSFQQRRFEVYQTELGSSLVLLLAIAGVVSLGGVPKARKFVPAVFIVLTVADLMLLGRHRLVDVGPLRPLSEQSPVLASLANEPRGTRTADPLRNLPMAAGLAPVQAYRTLDLPALTALGSLNRGPLDAEPYRELALRSMRATGVELRVIDPIEAANLRLRGGANGRLADRIETLSDPALARWIFGPDWNPEHQAWADEFQILRPTQSTSRVWFIPLSAVRPAGVFENWKGDPRHILDLLDNARPLRATVRSPLEWEVDVEDADGPGWVLISQLADPQWKARIATADGRMDVPANILPAFRVGSVGGAWQRVFIEKPVSGAAIHLNYEALDVQQGLWISGACWTCWCLAIIYVSGRRRAGWKRPDRRPSECDN